MFSHSLFVYQFHLLRSPRQGCLMLGYLQPVHLCPELGTERAWVIGMIGPWWPFYLYEQRGTFLFIPIAMSHTAQSRVKSMSPNANVSSTSQDTAR